MMAILPKNVRQSWTVTPGMEHLLDPPLDTTLPPTNELNVIPARAQSLENKWRFAGEFLEVFYPGVGRLDSMARKRL
jgi:hypothetical protein